MSSPDYIAISLSISAHLPGELHQVPQFGILFPLGHCARPSIGSDAEIRAGRPVAVQLVARVHLGKSTRNNYSFATKYCAWHNPASYPIYDSFVDQMLWGYKNQDRFDSFYRQDLWQYDRFTKVMLHFRDYYNLTSFSLKDIDKFLWLAGNDYYPASWKKPIAETSNETFDHDG